VRAQCSVLDQAVLYSALKNYDLLDHVEAVDDVFLLSERSDFLRTVGSAMVEEYLEGHSEAEHRIYLRRHRAGESGGGWEICAEGWWLGSSFLSASPRPHWIIAYST